MPPSQQLSRRRSGLRSSARPLLARLTWNIVVAAWLALVVGLFLKVRILDSATVTHLLQKIARR